MPGPRAACGGRDQARAPHFLAITLFRRDDYARAGLLVLPNEPGGDRKARRNIVSYTVALVSVSLLFVPLGVAHNLYFGTALCAGALFVAYGLNGLRPPPAADGPVTNSRSRWPI